MIVERNHGMWVFFRATWSTWWICWMALFATIIVQEEQTSVFSSLKGRKWTKKEKKP